MLVCVGLCATNSPSYFPGKYEPGNPKKPLHQCNFYGSVEAGNKMKEMLSLGSSRPWREAMQKMTGQRKMSTKAIREYFAPLEAWLKAENKKTGVTVGWGETDVDSMCQQAVPSRRELRGEVATNTTFQHFKLHFSGLNMANMASGASEVGSFSQVVLLVIPLFLLKTFYW